MTQAPPTFRPFEFGITRAVITKSGDHQSNHQYLSAEQSLGDYPQRMTDKLLHWAAAAPERTLYARRDLALGGNWRHLSFAQALQSARSIGQALLDRGLSAERPLVILSENSLEHAQLALGAMLVGVPFCAVSPAYSLVSQDFDKLRHVLDTLTPGLVYAADWKRYGRAMQATLAAGTEVILDAVSPNSIANYDDITLTLTNFADILATVPSPAVDAAMQATGPDTVVKFLFTSGSTKLPKAVVNTQRMICSNQQQMRQSMPNITQEPLVLMDWMPWNHTAGGNHNFFMAVFNGGTLYIDDGKPTPALLPETLRNLREIAPTWYFNVPVGFEAIAQAMTQDLALRRNFFSRIGQLFYAGASLAQPIWDSLYASAEAEIGQRVVMTAGLGMTESGPFGLFVTTPHSKAGDLGLPAAGLELKLVPMGDKTEVRYRGPNITPGYWRNPEATAESFDEEGFFCTGDAVLWIDPSDIHQGLRFDGRIAEDFKLSTGTFVSVGPMRAKMIAAGAPYIADVVITGLDRKEVGALVLPALGPCKKLCDLDSSATMQDIANNDHMAATMAKILQTMALTSTGSATRITRAVVMAEPPSIDKGEVTDKGSINQRAVLKCRDALVQALYAGTAPNMVLLPA